MKYSEELIHATLEYDYNDPDQERLIEIIHRNPRFGIACYASFCDGGGWSLPRLSFDSIGHVPLYGEDEISMAITPFDRTEEAMLSHEKRFTKIDHQSDIPNQPGWSRQLCLRENQYNEHHPALAEWQGRNATGGDVHVQYRNYTGRISGPSLEFVDGSPIWVMDSNLEHEDGGSIGDGIIEIYDRQPKRAFEIQDILDRDKTHILALGTIACYWEIDRAIKQKGKL